MTEHQSWAVKRVEAMSRSGAGAGYEAARLRFELGESVRHRRKELGLTQAELGERVGVKQEVVGRLEEGGAMLALPLLVRIAGALEMRLKVELQPLREG